MYKLLYTLIALCVIINTTAAQIFVGTAPMGVGDEFLVGTRWRNLSTSALAGDEKYLGVPDLGLPANRVATNFTYSSTVNVSFTYNATTDLITSTTINGGTTSTLTMNAISSRITTAGKLRPLSSMNVWQLRIRNRTPSSSTTVTNITLNGTAVPGSFTNSGNNSNLYWYAFSSAYGTTFTLTATIQLSGTYTGTGENNVVEMLWGSSISILPVKKVALTGALQQQNKLLHIVTESTEPIKKLVLLASKDGIVYERIDSTQQNDIGNHRFYDFTQKYTFYYAIAYTINGQSLASNIITLQNTTLAKPYRILRLSPQTLSLIAIHKPFTMVRLYNMAGKLQYIYSNTSVVNLSLPLGVYVMQLFVEEKMYSEKIVVP